MVATLSLLILLAVLSLGLLSVSALVSRSGNRVAVRAEAEANARLALMLAIGELQKQLGPDQRITANASIMADAESAVDSAASGSDPGPGQPHWLGVWDSFAGDNRYLHDRHEPGDLVPDLSEHRRVSFRRWIVSGAGGGAGRGDPLEEFDFARAADDSDFVELIGGGTSGPGAGEAFRVRAPPVELRGNTGPPGGTLAFWVGDESQKACLRPGNEDAELDDAVGLLAEIDAPSTIAAELFEQIEGPLERTMVERAALSRRSAGLLPNSHDLGELFHDLTVFSRSVLADVREGGLKRDLSVLGDAFSADFEAPDGLPVTEENMLYDLDNMDRVPLHDLLVYQQLHKLKRDDAPDVLEVAAAGHRRPHVEPIAAAEYGSQSARGRGISAPYRQAVAAKMQVAVWARAVREGGDPQRPYGLRLRLVPVLTLWNPYNVPIKLRGDLTAFWLALAAEVGVFEPGRRNGETALLNTIGSGAIEGYYKGNQWNFLFSRVEDRSTMAPGESRVYSLDRVYHGSVGGGAVRNLSIMEPGYRPLSGVEIDYRTLTGKRHDSGPSPAYRLAPGDIRYIGLGPVSQRISQLGDVHNGRAFEFHLQPELGYNWRYLSTQTYSSRGIHLDEARNKKRFPLPPGHLKFLENMFGLGERLDGAEIRNLDTGTVFTVRPYSIDELATPEGMQVATISLGHCGESEVLNDRYGNGVRFPCRPFLHSLATCGWRFITGFAPRDLYLSGIRWCFEDGDEAANEITVSGAFGRFGSGWSAFDGQRHAVQFELPQRPFHSLAQFNHAVLDGRSIKSQLGSKNGWSHEHGGLEPAMAMAVGNSYALPQLAPGEAFIEDWFFRYWADSTIEGWPDAYFRGQCHAPLVDHSYLANHALWDEFFMSSLCDHVGGVYALAAGAGFGRTGRGIARDLFERGAEPPPNDRIVAAPGASWEVIEPLLYGDHAPKPGAERIIARYLLLEGGFNVNSTSREAWKTVLAALRNKPTPVLEPAAEGFDPGLAENHDETPAGSFTIANGPAVAAASPGRADLSSPEQWTGYLTLDDEQIDTLAGNIVREVRRRGPFLSLSDFVNRRLSADSADRDLALYGALQAAIEASGLNDQFHAGRSAELGRESDFLKRIGIRDPGFEFPEAADGPAACGSNAYLDQADLLRAIDTVIVPRGDTFVVRAYGDAKAPDGAILARAWCEATVQRTPAYLDPAADQPETKAAELAGQTNRNFGRRFRLVSFRWLNPDEV